MSFWTRTWRFALIALALVGLFGATTTMTQAATSKETIDAVKRILERLPYYGVFDFIAFKVDRGSVTLAGYSYQAGLKADAARGARRVAGIDEIVNRIEELPVSLNDDRIRWETFYRIYTDDFLSRYAPGGPHEVARQARESQRFPGMQPVGVYPIHIVVRGGRTMLLGIVDNATDRQLAGIRAREVSGVFAVENSLELVSPETRSPLR